MDTLSREPRRATRGAARGTALVATTICASLAAGCMTAKVDETRQTTGSIQANESIVLLKKPQLEGVGTEEVFLDCVQERLGGELVHPESGQNAKAGKAARVPFKIYGEQEFTDAMFPWFEPSTAPANAGGLRTLLQRPGVTERLQQIKVRYIVWLDGNTRKTDGGGSVACAAGPGGAGCIGVGWWEKESGYVATVWDMQNATEIGTVSADVTGTSVLIGAIAPIPIITPVRRAACDRLSNQLRSFLEGDDMTTGTTGGASTGAAKAVKAAAGGSGTL
jgi:hypothetical protein